MTEAEMREQIQELRRDLAIRHDQLTEARRRAFALDELLGKIRDILIDPPATKAELMARLRVAFTESATALPARRRL